MKREVKIMDNLINLVLKQIQDDVDSGDLTALEELLKRVPAKVLESYLPEVDMDEVETEYDGQPDEAQEWHDFDPDC
jgi:hypothetical protein